jgi:hypothetical protein
VTDDYQLEPRAFDRFNQGLLSYNSEFKLDVPNYLVTFGIYSDRQNYNILSRVKENAVVNDQILMEGIGSYWLHQPYVKIEKPVSDKLIFYAGLNGIYHSLRGKFNLGPRLEISYYPDEKRSIKFQYGLVNKSQIPQTYYILDPDNGSLPNKNLGYTRSHQIIAGYEQYINDQTGFKIEGYIQKHFDVPVSPDPGDPYSIVNAEDAFINKILVNRGTAVNNGLEITLDRNFYRNYYILLNGTWYQSTYRASDGLKRNTRFNGQYGLNITSGKEFVKDMKSHDRVLGINIRGLFHGGPWMTPIDEALSRLNQAPVYINEKAFSRKLMDYFRVDIGIYLKKNKKHYTRSIIFGLQNVTNRKNIAYQYYDQNLNRINTKYQLGIIPSLLYRVEF